MPKPFAVRVRRLADDTVQDMPYKSFLYVRDDIDDVTLQKKFELVGELDAKGNLIPGNPNLDPQYRTELPQVVNQDAAPVADNTEVKTQERKKPGPKPRRPAEVKLQETTA
jgi:hypothetical protein